MDGDGGRLSAAEKGKQKVADDADLPAALVLGSKGELRPAADAVANCYGGGGGAGVPLPRQLLIPPSGTSEIEEAPPSPPPAARSRLPAQNAADAAAAAVVGRLKNRVMELHAGLKGQLRELQQLRRESEGSKGVASKRRREGDDEPGPEVAGGAEVQALQHQGNNSKCKAKEMQALEEFWKPVPVPPRNNSKRMKKPQMVRMYLGGDVHRCNEEVTPVSIGSSNVGRSSARGSGSSPNEKARRPEELTSSMTSYKSELVENLRITWHTRQKEQQEKQKELEMKVIQVEQFPHKKTAGCPAKVPLQTASDIDLPNEGFEFEMVPNPLSIRIAVIEGRKGIDYMHNNRSKVKSLRSQDPFQFEKCHSDHRFHSLFQCDFYNSVYYAKKTRVLRQKWINWSYCSGIPDPDFQRALASIEEHNLKDIMQFRYDWSEEVIAQFFATLWYGSPTADSYPQLIHFMIEGQRYEVSLARFAKILGFDLSDLDKFHIHDRSSLSCKDLRFMYSDSAATIGTTHHLLNYYKYITLLARSTIIPKGGNASNICSSLSSLLYHLKDGGGSEFSVAHLLWSEILTTSWDPKRSCSHAPYLMKVIEVVTKKSFVKEVKHEPYHPVAIIEDGPKRGRRPAAALPSPQRSPSSGSPVPSSPQHPSSSRAADPDCRSTLVLEGIASIFGMCMHSIKAQREHEQYVLERLHRIETIQQRLAQAANLQPPLSPPRELSPPYFCYPQMFEQQQQFVPHEPQHPGEGLSQYPFGADPSHQSALESEIVEMAQYYFAPTDPPMTLPTTTSDFVHFD